MATTRTTLVVEYDDNLVTGRFMAEHVLELEGVYTVEEV